MQKDQKNGVVGSQPRHLSTMVLQGETQHICLFFGYRSSYMIKYQIRTLVSYDELNLIGINEFLNLEELETDPAFACTHTILNFRSPEK